MRFYSRFILVLLSAPLGLAAPSTTAAHNFGLSADIVTTYKVGGRFVTTRGHYYRSADGRLREDSELGALILDMKKRRLTTLSFARQEAVVFALPAEETRPAELTSRTPMPSGHIVYDGQPVTQSRVTLADGATQETWTADELGLVVLSKLETSTATTIRELKNISRTEPADSLFESPHGFSLRWEVLPATPTVTGLSGHLPSVANHLPPGSRK